MAEGLRDALVSNLFREIIKKGKKKEINASKIYEEKFILFNLLESELR